MGALEKQYQMNDGSMVETFEFFIFFFAYELLFFLLMILLLV